MPNWCYQKMLVEGSPIDLARFKQTCLPEGVLELNRIVPMPRELDVQEGSDGHTGYEALYGDWEKVASSMSLNVDVPAVARISREAFVAWLESERPDTVSLGRQYQENIARFGHRSWYGWRVEHWGTKWEIGADQQSVAEENDSSFLIQFETAWSTIHPVLCKMACRYPDLRFTLWYLDEGGGFAGCSYVQGLDYSDEDLEWRKLAEEEFGWDFADEDEEEAAA